MSVEKLLILTAGSLPGTGVLALLAAVAAAAWVASAVAWRVVGSVMTAVANVSTVAAASLVFAVIALTG